MKKGVWAQSNKLGETQCYGLIMKCPPQGHGLNTWFSDVGAILGVSENFRRWGF
jgi:hypothetical protein